MVLNEAIDELGCTISETQTEITAAKLPVIKGYYYELKQLFYHLISNSVKFRKKDSSPKINVWAMQKNGSWQFGFADNGIGIAREHSDRIFVIFQRLHTRSEYIGSGIGLSHCKKIVELHKGKIWLESELGNGSTFYFTIPNISSNV
jgi:light-regulated signal transduction histidine kinase (bacteriophytochrome)